MYDAPHYKGSEKLLDKVALITGGDSWNRTVLSPYCSPREGADIAMAYLDEHEDAEETKQRSRAGRPSLYPIARRCRRSDSSANMRSTRR